MKIFVHCFLFIASAFGVSSSPIEPNEIRRIDGYSEGERCLAGELFYDKCNLCRCAANGLSAGCTLMPCPSEEDFERKAPPTQTYSWPHIDGYVHGDSCPPGRLFFNECNLCRCNEDGKYAACTMIFCLPDQIREKRSLEPAVSTFNWPRIDGYKFGDACPPNQMFYNACNVCRCFSDGSFAMCTMMFCAPE